jgi:hypothetical protein
VPVDDAEATAQAKLPFSTTRPPASAGAEARELVARECAPAPVAAQREACCEDAIARH